MRYVHPNGDTGVRLLAGRRKAVWLLPTNRIEEYCNDLMKAMAHADGALRAVCCYVYNDIPAASCITTKEA